MPDTTGSTLFFDSHSLSGRAPCNSYGAEFEFDGEAISVGQILQSLIGCSDGVEAAETAYLSALSRVTSASIEGGELVFTGPDVELRFTR
ncbi:hypothetical protein BH23CHL9_BH23CHL9_13670 [soil metagenome]